MLTTQLTDWHKSHGAKCVDFSGYEMPLHYGSQIDEHHAVRQSQGMFDVSHMLLVEIEGRGALPFMRRLIANNIDQAQPFQALYTCMLNEQGGIIDDCIVYYVNDERVLMVVNAGNRDTDIAWMNTHAEGFDVTISPQVDYAIIALQGPKALETAKLIYPEAASLKPFYFLLKGKAWIARTGYTGESGLEVMLPNTEVETLWQEFYKAGVTPCGLGARDTLRLEAGLCLHGQDMTADTTPFEANLSWTVSLDDGREFIGKEALLTQKGQGVKQVLTGIVLQDKGVLRSGHNVYQDDKEVGVITSGSYSPTLGCSIGLARISSLVSGGPCEVEIRGKRLHARQIRPPFIRHGKPAPRLLEIFSSDGSF